MSPTELPLARAASRGYFFISALFSHGQAQLLLKPLGNSCPDVLQVGRVWLSPGNDSTALVLLSRDIPAAGMGQHGAAPAQGLGKGFQPGLGLGGRP